MGKIQYNNTTMEDNFSSILSIVSIAVSVAGIVLGVINHKRIRSNCCGTKGEISFDIENTTPVDATKDKLFEKKPELTINAS